MTINRIGPFLPPETADGAPRVGTFWFLRLACGGYLIDTRTARRIARLLDRWWDIRPRRWITFRDLAGSEVRVRRADIRALVEATPTTRAGDRRIERAREAEEKADSPPPWAEE